MAAQTSLTVKKLDGTTDIIYDALVASAGDSIPAIWRQDTGQAGGKPTGLRPTFSMAAKWNGPKTARQVLFEYRYPYVTQDSTTTRYSSTDQVVVKTIVTLPQSIPSSELSEATTQALQLCGLSAVRSQTWSGYAFT